MTGFSVHEHELASRDRLLGELPLPFLLPLNPIDLEQT